MTPRSGETSQGFRLVSGDCISRIGAASELQRRLRRPRADRYRKNPRAGARRRAGHTIMPTTKITAAEIAAHRIREHVDLRVVVFARAAAVAFGAHTASSRPASCYRAFVTLAGLRCAPGPIPPSAAVPSMPPSPIVSTTDEGTMTIEPRSLIAS